MMYEVNKTTLRITENPDAFWRKGQYVSIGRSCRKGKDTHISYFAETLEEAQAKAAELRAEKVAHYERVIEYHEDQALYNRGRLAAILKEHHPDAGKVMDEKKPG